MMLRSPRKQLMLIIIIVPRKLQRKFCVQQSIVYSLQKKTHVYLLRFDAPCIENFYTITYSELESHSCGQQDSYSTPSQRSQDFRLTQWGEFQLYLLKEVNQCQLFS